MIIHHSVKIDNSNIIYLLQLSKWNISKKHLFSQLTANESIRARTLSPISELVSCPNCTNAPKNRFTLVKALAGSCNIFGVAACGVDADVANGGVAELAGETVKNLLINLF